MCLSSSQRSIINEAPITCHESTIPILFIFGQELFQFKLLDKDTEIYYISNTYIKEL